MTPIKNEMTDNKKSMLQAPFEQCENRKLTCARYRATAY